MTTLQLTIKALSPLAIGRQKPGGSISEAQTYIPGSVIRGAIAGKMLRQSSTEDNTNLAQPDSDFQQLFLAENAATFSNAYPSPEGQPVYVLPATAVSSKNDPGFRPGSHPDNPDFQPEKPVGVFDTLIDAFCAEGYGYPYDPVCINGDRAEPYSQFYTVENGKYRAHHVDTRLLTRVGINRRRATAQEQVLYSIEVINETQIKNKQPTVFSSTISIEDDALADQLTTYLGQQLWRFGGSASRGLGKVEIEVKPLARPNAIKTRIKDFNQKLHDRWKDWGEVFSHPQPFPDNQQYFTLDLQAEAILVDQWRSTTVISPEMLCQMADMKDSTLQLHSVYSSYDYRSGWNAAWGLMKDVELVTNRGAVYLFSTSQLEKWLPQLEQLEIKGVGERTTEGFGQVQVCNEFHHVFREEPV
ncbi:CRISPR-associated RAMP protein Csx10 [Nodosilinea sp. LEGE 07088]|uniref:type III-D CRISPR-associated RAMP protein Csx10 n=1 Tax=Nodosilinea sp. LEGE 07088 TaxID=2777968 RepID=UPI00187FF66D|nr:CRISPR-associated RAMP protein Csx10 [Nodosilinea sp. LEGE 07088]MBE9138826.1 CRISPR-associated RAMP protein Csx10 [Nodosilinea sp. LEGE 07088]